MSPQKWIAILIIGIVANGERASEEFRLPENIIPEHYDIKILTDLNTDFSYNGEVRIDFLVKSDTNKIVLHSKNIKILENETKLEEHRTLENIIRRPKRGLLDQIPHPKIRVGRKMLEEEQKTSEKMKAEKDKITEMVDRLDMIEKTTSMPNKVENNAKEDKKEEEMMKETLEEVASTTKKPFKVAIMAGEEDDVIKDSQQSSMMVEEKVTSTRKPIISNEAAVFMEVEEKPKQPEMDVDKDKPSPSTEMDMDQEMILASSMSSSTEMDTDGFKETHSTTLSSSTEMNKETDHLPKPAIPASLTEEDMKKENHPASPMPSSTDADKDKHPAQSTTSPTEKVVVSTTESYIVSTTQRTTNGLFVTQLAATTEPTKEVLPTLKESFRAVKHDYEYEKNFLVIHLDKNLKAGMRYTLGLRYSGVLTDTLTGFYRVPYTKKSSQKSTWLAATVFEPNEARSAFPCFDEPALKATFDVTLGHDKIYTALSNMPLKSTSPVSDRPDWQWSTFDTTPRMSTYLLAFVISDLEYLTPRQNYTSAEPKVTYRFWSRSEVLYKTRYAMRIAPEMKNYLENLLEVPDVLPKHDFVALPSFISNALENWGLYSFSEKNLLFTPGFSSIFSKYEITHVLGHEIAHMWFGNMVTPKWWDQIWLNEGFSNFFEIVAADHVQPNWDLKTVSLIYAYLKVFSLDALHTSHPLVPRINQPNDLNEIFDSISYQKGFYLVRMLNYTLGEEAFLGGIREYLKKNQFSNVDESDLWEVLTKHGHSGNLPKEYHLKDIMKSWTRKTGYPIVEVIRDYENNTATVTQRRFLRSKDDYEFRHHVTDADSEDTKWWIPLTYTTGTDLDFSDTKPKVWLNPEDENTTLEDMPSRSDFVLMNLDAAGLYRVKYDERNWALLISFLINDDHSEISVINRVQILDDLLDLARSGEISYEKALDATSYLRKERHFLPWKAALSNFDYISRMLRSTDSNRAFKRFIRTLVTPRFDELGFESIKNESLSDGLNRKQIVKWACKTGVRQCTRKSIALFKRWTEERKPDENNPIPSNLRGVVYCSAIENGGAKDWQFLWQRYLSNVVTDKTAILYGLGCTKNTRTLRKYLDWSLKESSGIKKQDSPTVFKAVVRNDAGFGLAKNFIKDRWEDIRKYFGNHPSYFPQMIEAVAAKMNRPKDLEELEELEQEHLSKLRSLPRSVRQATERVRFNINWIDKHYRTIKDWLKVQKM